MVYIERLLNDRNDMASNKVAFHDLKSEDFPFEVSYYDAETEEVLHRQTVREPGVLSVPGFAPRKVNVLVRYATGQTLLVLHDGSTYEGQLDG